MPFSEFGISERKIVATVTDNGFNFLKALKEFGLCPEKVSSHRTVFYFELFILMHLVVVYSEYLLLTSIRLVLTANVTYIPISIFLNRYVRHHSRPSIHYLLLCCAMRPYGDD